MSRNDSVRLDYLTIIFDVISMMLSSRSSASISGTTQLQKRWLKASPISGLHSISAYPSTMFLNCTGLIPNL